MNWEEIRENVDKAIRAGQTKDDFCDENDISRGQWYSMKPKGFKWHKIQLELGVKVKKPRSAKEPEVKEEEPDDMPTEQICPKKGCGQEHFATEECLCPYCKVELLEGLMRLYRGGFSDDQIREALE